MIKMYKSIKITKQIMDISFIVFLVLAGLPVMHSYYVATRSNHAGRLVGFQGWTFWLWAVSSIVTIAAYFAYVVQLLLTRDVVEPHFYIVFALFTSTASGWVGYSLIALREVQLRWNVFINLMMTAAGSCAMLVFGIMEGDILLITSGSWLLMHHLVIDAGMWTWAWFRQIQQRVAVASEDGADTQLKPNYTKVIF